MSRRPAGGYNVLASTGACFHVDALQNGIQFRVAVDTQTSEFLNQGTKGLAPRSVQQTGLVQTLKLSPRTNRASASRNACGAPLVARQDVIFDGDSHWAEFPNSLSRRASPILCDGCGRPRLTIDADEAVEECGGAAQTSGQARPVGWSGPARPFAAEQRLIVLIEGNQSCRGTIHQPAQADSNVVSHQRLPHTALAWLEQYPYRSLPTLPTHRFVLLHFRSN